MGRFIGENEFMKTNYFRKCASKLVGQSEDLFSFTQSLGKKQKQNGEVYGIFALHMTPVKLLE